MMKKATKMFCLEVVSNSFFVIASALYLWLSVLGLWYEDQVKDFPDYVLETDDDPLWKEWYPQDDYVFRATDGPHGWVSKYQMIYFSAALCFVVTGALDLWIKSNCFIGGTMLLAGCFGLLASIYVDKDEELESAYNAVSVHLFLLEGFLVLFGRYGQDFGDARMLLLVLCVGDGCFFVGSVMDVAFAYLFITGHYGHEVSKISVLASVLWLVAALIYLSTTIWMHRNGKDDNNCQQRGNNNRGDHAISNDDPDTCKKLKVAELATDEDCSISDCTSASEFSFWA